MGTVGMVMMMMAGHNNSTCNVTPTNTNTEPNPSSSAVFHDFLGGKVANFDNGSTVPEASLGPFSSASDLASERQMSGQFEKISSYGPRNDLSVAEISNRLVGSKRSHSDSSFMGSSREGFPQITPEGSHMMKMIRNASGGERPRSSHYEGRPLHGGLQMRPVSGSFVLHPTTSTNTNLAKSERSIPMNIGQYNTSIGQASPLAYQLPSSRFRDSSSCPSVLSQLAADEGSRTGNKASGILSSVNISNVVSERNPSELLTNGSKIKLASHNSEPESSNPPSRRGLTTSSSRQMTIIYCGQVHVFDDVHPNKADVIMAMAGSNGGSWSTTLEHETSRKGDRSLSQK